MKDENGDIIDITPTNLEKFVIWCKKKPENHIVIELGTADVYRCVLLDKNKNKIRIGDWLFSKEKVIKESDKMLS